MVRIVGVQKKSRGKSLLRFNQYKTRRKKYEIHKEIQRERLKVGRGLMVNNILKRIKESLDLIMRTVTMHLRVLVQFW